MPPPTPRPPSGRSVDESRGWKTNPADRRNNTPGLWGQRWGLCPSDGGVYRGWDTHVPTSWRHLRARHRDFGVMTMWHQPRFRHAAHLGGAGAGMTGLAILHPGLRGRLAGGGQIHWRHLREAGEQEPAEQPLHNNKYS